MKVRTDTAVHSDYEIPNKMKIKEEDVVFDIGSPEEERSAVSNILLRIRGDTAICTDGEAEEDLMLDIDLLKEFRPPIEKYIKSEPHSDSEMQNKIKIKEQILVMDINVENEESFPSSDTMKIKNKGDVDEMVSKIEIKEEPWWQESSSAEMKLQPGVLFLTDFQVYDEIKDGAIEDLPATESTRLHTEAAPSNCNTTPYVFPTADLEEKDGFKCGKESLEFSVDNIQNVYRSDIAEASSVEQTVCHLKPKTHAHDPSDKLNKCGNKLHEMYKKSFSQQNDLKAHILTHEGKIPFKCDICKRIFTRKGDLRRHIMIHQGERPFKCDVCENRFTRKGDLNKHILIHQGKRPFNCDLCGNNFTRKGGLKRHIMFHQGIRPFKCDFCEKGFIEQVQLNRHILVHQNERPFKCDFCEKSFKWKRSLKQHILIHQNKRPFTCYFCEKSFIGNGQLRKHVLTHLGERPLICDYCDKTFIEKVHLRRHILSHLGIRPFKCDLCEQRFMDTGHLKKHIIVHQGKSPHKCDVCESSFTQKRYLNKHILIHQSKRPN